MAKKQKKAVSKKVKLQSKVKQVDDGPKKNEKKTVEPEHEEKESKKVVNTDEQKKITNTIDEAAKTSEDNEPATTENENHEELKDGDIGKEDVENAPDREEIIEK